MSTITGFPVSILHLQLMAEARKEMGAALLTVYSRHDYQYIRVQYSAA